jgi:membrane fusion protein (multidrug efflux system)
VGVVTVQPASVALATELPGRLEARRSAQVRARVPGIVQQRLFTEGSLVKAGQPLYKLDAGSYEAALASAQAGVARAEASVAAAQAEVERNRPLAEARAISAQEWLVRQTTLRLAQAEMATARAAVQGARVNLDYTAIQAPIAGRIGRSQVSEGALVGQGDVAPMAVIQQTDSLYVNFTQSAADVLRLRQTVESGRLQRAGDGATEVRVVLGDGSAYPVPGRLLFTDPTVDPTTGQVSLRAELPNPKGLLFPGLFVQVKLSQVSAAQGIRLPQQAVTRGPDADTVLVVGDDNKPVKRVVKISGAMGADWVVLDGLKAGERVIADGFQKMFVPGAPVTPVPWSPLSAAPQPAQSAQAAVGASAPASAASR